MGLNRGRRSSMFALSSQGIREYGPGMGANRVRPLPMDFLFYRKELG